MIFLILVYKWEEILLNKFRESSGEKGELLIFNYKLSDELFQFEKHKRKLIFLVLPIERKKSEKVDAIFPFKELDKYELSVTFKRVKRLMALH